MVGKVVKNSENREIWCQSDIMAALTSNMVPQAHHHHFATRSSSTNLMESTDGSISMDSNDHFDRGESPNIDQNSCSSDDTVLSVGNENPPLSESGTSSELSFKNIESHLNAISQITNSTLDPNKSLSSPPNNRLLSPSSTKSGPPSSPGSYISYTKPDPSDVLFRRAISPPDSPSDSSRKGGVFFNDHKKSAPVNNNDAINNASLKFSIDNILKADFGRSRITDPINIRKCKPANKKVVDIGGAAGVTQGDDKGPVDLSKSETGKKAENQPMLWPAWVYCTRYSDRPSSGGLFLFFESRDKQNQTGENLLIAREIEKQLIDPCVTKEVLHGRFIK